MPDSSSPSPETQDSQTQTPEIISTVGDALKLLESHRAENQTTPGLKPTAQPSTKPTGLNSKRKFDGLEEHEKQMFDRMSTEAYNYLYPKYLKQKETEQKLAELQTQNSQLKEVSFYDQDGAWRITPEYSTYEKAVNQLNGETAFWTEQLANIEAGNKCTALIGYDDKGNPQFMHDLEPTPQIRAQFSAALNKSLVLANDYQNKLAQYENGFKEKHTSYLGQLKEVRNKIFAGADLTKLEKAAQEKLKIFPQFTHQRPEVKMLAESLVVVDGLLSIIKQLKNTNATNGVKHATAISAGPTSDRITAGGGTGVKTVGEALAEMKKMRDSGQV